MHKTFKNNGFTLTEVMISAAILVTVIAAFAVIATSINSLSNVRARNVAYSIANDEISRYENNSGLLNAFNFDVGQPVPSDPANGTNAETRNIGENDSGVVSQTFNIRSNFFPVNSQGVNLINNGTNQINGSSNLIRMVVEVQWTDRNGHIKTVTQEGFIRK